MYSRRSSNFFEPDQKGEMFELKNDLNSVDRDVVKSAVKKIIELMSLGEDLTDLFPDVIRSMSTKDIELKKLVYLYAIHYAHKQPEKAILVVNTFQKDASSHNSPLVRALAIRTMGCIRVPRVTEYLFDPLSNALGDSDPYVRKSAVICVAKLFAINSALVIERGFLDRLRLCISDSNPMVVSNAVASIIDIAKSFPQVLEKISATNCRQLVSALGECTEWGQIYVLDLLALCHRSVSDTLFALERVVPRLSHSNVAVVLAAIKVVILLCRALGDKKQRNAFMGRLRPSLITLLNSGPEMQYVALKNLRLLADLFPTTLSQNRAVLFCRYNDPPYIKVEKIWLLVYIANEASLDQILSEFYDYAQEVDIDFARIAVKAIGQLALRLESKLEKCAKSLKSLLRLKRDYLTNQIVIVVKDILWKYEGCSLIAILDDLLEFVDKIDQPESEEAMVWLLGEFVGEIKGDAFETLTLFFEGFSEVDDRVKYQLLTASVKFYLKEPQHRQKEFLDTVLKACEEYDYNIDLNDRALFYKDLLGQGLNTARKVVLEKSPQTELNFKTPSKTKEAASNLFRRIKSISLISSVYEDDHPGRGDDFDEEELPMDLQLLLSIASRHGDTPDAYKAAAKEYSQEMRRRKDGSGISNGKTDVKQQSLSAAIGTFGEEPRFVEENSEEEIVKGEAGEDLISFDSVASERVNGSDGEKSLIDFGVGEKSADEEGTKAEVTEEVDLLA